MDLLHNTLEIDDTEFTKNNYMWELIRQNNLFKYKEEECNYCIIKA